MKNVKKLFFIAIFFILSVNVFALSVPTLTSPVMDNAGIISASKENQLVQYLNNISNETGSQIAVLTIPSLQGESIESYSMKVAEKWQLGSKEKDDGVLLLVAVQERSLRIEVGYGLEESLTDIRCGLIIRTIITPYFKKGDYESGIMQGVEAIAKVALGTDDEITSTKVQNKYEEEIEGATAGLGIAGFIVMFIIFSIFRILSGSRRGGFLSNLLWFSLLSGGRNRHHGGGKHGGFGGGGFGGFSGGGGGFGGGGASGGW